jgi:hypothetical protein
MFVLDYYRYRLVLFLYYYGGAGSTTTTTTRDKCNLRQPSSRRWGELRHLFPTTGTGTNVTGAIVSTTATTSSNHSVKAIT